jgi:3-phenylpropionate/trans-cinnamate dioxygenase ferredoxin subunit
MSGWIAACGIDDISLRRGRILFVGGAVLAAFRDGEAVHVLDDSCPHAGASLAGGAVEDGVVRCPAHGLRFDLATGCMRAGGLAAKPWLVRVEAGRVWVADPGDPPLDGPPSS